MITHFLAKRIGYDFIEYEKKQGIDTVCRMCGCPITSGYSTKDVIKKTFTDYDYLRFESDHVCADCTVCLGKIAYEKNGETKETYLRCFSFLATDHEFITLPRVELLPLILNPPNPPFALTITYLGQKHTAFKSHLNYDRFIFLIRTDKGDVLVDVALARQISEISQRWYSEQPEKPTFTWFTKDEILHGCSNLMKIENYGLQKYFQENQLLSQWRGLPLFELIIHCLQKEGQKDVNSDSI